MGLYDREYMREDESGHRRGPAAPWSPTIALLVVLGAVFVAQWFIPHKIEYQLALSLDGILHGHLWQLVTFQFLHGGFLHILLNGITLYSFGRFMEMSIGRGRFLTLYFLSGIAGGILQVAAIYLLRQDPFSPVVGASAGIAGLLGGFAALHPRRRLTILLFVFPVTVRADILLWILVGISLLGTFVPFGGLAHAAHLGGLLAGLGWMLLALKKSARVSQGASSWRVPPILGSSPPPNPSTTSPDEFIANDVDPILDKIATHGIHSLSERERKVLDSARKKITGR
jgi:membrane associated rhomboid family serine protease